MLQQPWWTSSGFVIGLIASGFMIFYWLRYWRVEIVKKGWRYTSYSTVLPWVLIFSTSLRGLLTVTGFICIGSTVDVVFLYANAILPYIVLVVLVIAMIVDVLLKACHKVQRPGMSKRY